MLWRDILRVRTLNHEPCHVAYLESSVGDWDHVSDSESWFSRAFGDRDTRLIFPNSQFWFKIEIDRYKIAITSIFRSPPRQHFTIAHKKKWCSSHNSVYTCTHEQHSKTTDRTAQAKTITYCPALWDNLVGICIRYRKKIASGSPYPECGLRRPSGGAGRPPGVAVGCATPAPDLSEGLQLLVLIML